MVRPDLFPHPPKRVQSLANDLNPRVRQNNGTAIALRGRTSDSPHDKILWRSSQARGHTSDSPAVQQYKSQHRRAQSHERQPIKRSHNGDTSPPHSQNTRRSRTEPLIAQQFESRGTQTERTGPCKCARAVQERNKKRRQQNKQNTQIVQVLERTNILRFADTSG